MPKRVRCSETKGSHFVAELLLAGDNPASMVQVYEKRFGSKFTLLISTAAMLACSAPVSMRHEVALVPAPTSETLWAFRTAPKSPNRLLAHADGNLYGTASEGGVFGSGALFRLASDGSVSVLHSFSGTDGSAPKGALAADVSGRVYGATSTGGANGQGTLFRWEPGVGLTVLHHFGAADGQLPSSVALTADGTLYGTAQLGGTNGYGTLYRWSSATGFQALHHFDRTQGSSPYAGVVVASDGALYGSTGHGGQYSRGTLYRWSAAGGFVLLHSFSNVDGANPFWGGLVEGSDGAFYGTTTAGGANGFGTIFKWQTGVGLTTLHTFGFSAEGGYPYGGVTQGSDGAFYGTLATGGATGQYGRVFRWAPAGGFTALHTFTYFGGASPQWGVVQGLDGNLYGPTNGGGAGNGVLFRIDTAGTTFNVRHQFGGDPWAPAGRVARAADGSLRGTTQSGGLNNQGGIYSVASGTLSLLHSFNWTDGSAPETGLILASDGAYYGTTTSGGFDCGTLFKWDDVSGFVNLHSFTRATDGCSPIGGLIQASDGFFYGTTVYGGTNEAGTLFKWDGAFSVLHHFTPATDGSSPLYAGIMQGTDGAFYGTASSGGPQGAGTLFKWDGALSVLHAFAFDGNGASPSAGVVEGLDGAFYGTTTYGGASDLGTLFKWSSAGGLTVLHPFNGTNGQYPYLPLARRGNGVFYGTVDTATLGMGSVFQWDPSDSTFTGVYDLTLTNGAYPTAWLTQGTPLELLGTAREQGPEGGGTLFRLVFIRNLVSIAVTPASPSVIAGATQAFVATASYDDGTSQDVTATATWASSATGVATVSNASGTKGVATSIAAGTTDVSATLSGITGQTTLSVTAPVLVSIAVTPNTPSIVKGFNQAFVATGTYNNGSTQNLTNGVTWASSSTAVATISNASGSQGVAASTGVGNTTISATLGGVTGTATLTVTPALLVSISVTPANTSLPRGTTRAYTAIGTYTDSTIQDLSNAVTWASSSTTIASVSNAAGTRGLVSALAIGTTSISATLGGVTGQTPLAVTAATLVAIDILPVDPTLPRGTTMQFSAIGTYTDDSTQDITSSVTWSSSAPSIATVSNSAGTKGFANAVNAGTATLTAALGALSDTSDVTVTSATLVSINVTPATPSIPLGQFVQFSATGTYSDATTQDLTAQVTWTSSAPAVATISNVVGTKGRATSVSPGSTTITAAFGAVSSARTLTVTGAVLVSLVVSPASASVPVTYRRPFTATGTYSDGSTSNVTNLVTWASSNVTVATISNAAGSNGLATVSAAGTSTLSATLSGISATATLTGVNATLLSIAVSPANATISVGQTLQLTAVGTFSGGITLDITTQVGWSSQRKRTASVNTTGLVTGIRVRSTAVEIRARKSGVTGRAFIRVQ
ncbi:MAG: beta strand repeat-containing protein [Myxococcaceae bacterium]